MNNEEKILELLAQIHQEQKTTNDRLAKLEAGQAAMQEDIDEINTNVKYIWQEIDRFGERISEQDRIIQTKIV